MPDPAFDAGSCPICQGKGVVLDMGQLKDSGYTRTEERPWVEGDGLPAVYFVCAGCDGQATLAAYTARVLSGEFPPPPFNPRD